MPQLRTLRLVTLSAVFLLSGCPAVSSLPGGDARPPLRNADYFLQNARSAEGDRRALMLLSAGELLLDEARNSEALDTLWPLRNHRYSERDDIRLRLALAGALVNGKRGDDALAQLDLLGRPERLAEAQQFRARQLRIQALELGQRYLDAAREQLQLAIAHPERISELMQPVWSQLQKAETGQVEQARGGVREPTLAGWLDLSLLHRRYRQDPDGLKHALAQWRQQYPRHPAGATPPPELARVDAAERLELRSIALLLPLSGRYASTGRLVRDGFLSAMYAEGAPAVPVRVYDSGEQVVDAYRRAVADGASAVVGPLLKEQVQQLQALGTLPVPTLALNVSDQNTPVSGLFQFGLPVEDEAAQLAQRAVQSYKRALIIVSDDAVGERAAQTLGQQFLALGGEVAAVARVGDSGVEPVVAQLLGIDASKQRQKVLQQTIARELSFQPRRRQDIDVILMVARPAAARATKPWLNHYFAQDIPVLATSYLYGGSSAPAQDRDLDGVEFCDAPWTVEQGEPVAGLRRELGRYWPAATGAQARLFALGYDAAGLLPELARLQVFTDYRLPGLTGALSVDGNGRIHRQLSWARFRDGRVHTLGTRTP